MFALYEGTSGNPAQAVDCTAYSNQLLSKGWTNTTELPIFADGTRTLANITPMTQNAHPELCALTPELAIISCYAGHGKIENALQDIRVHAGLTE
jgi:hypothetical protein